MNEPFYSANSWIKPWKIKFMKIQRTLYKWENEYCEVENGIDVEAESVSLIYSDFYRVLIVNVLIW